MKKKVLCLMLVLVLCISMSPTVSAATDSEPSTVSATSTTTEIQERENAANSKYHQLLKHWAKDPNIIDDVDANFPAFYGGAYIDDEKHLVIQVTILNKEIKDYFAQIIDLTDVGFNEVKYSYERLMLEQNVIVEKMFADSKDEKIASISGVGISIPENAVTLYVVATGEKTDAELFCQSVRESASSFSSIKTIITDEKDSPCAAVRPGSEIKNRSVGFWAYDDNDVKGVITAPHSTIQHGDPIFIGSDRFGTARTPYFSGSLDAVFIERTNTDFTPSRYVPGGAFDLYSGLYAFLVVGSTTYSRGITSGYQVGEVIDINYTTVYGIRNCVITDAPCDLGDSGGIVAGSGDSSDRYVAGIITGRQGGTSYIMYIKAGSIISDLDVTIW